jgi:protein kinase A
VKLVKHKTTKTAYALKTMRKRQLIALKQVTHVMNEKKLLALCDHPFLINLVASFQDEIELYMVLELALGGELFSLLRDRMRFDEATARFYAACVVSAFIQMHDKKIAYRDLKPENLLLDKGGYIKICDFGFAKIVEDRTFTLCGTPEYLAPEIIASVGHGLPVDWWAMGILIYEMLCGDPPFVSDDPMQLYQQILSGKYSFPNFVGKQARARHGGGGGSGAHPCMSHAGHLRDPPRPSAPLSFDAPHVCRPSPLTLARRRERL